MEEIVPSAETQETPMNSLTKQYLVTRWSKFKKHATITLSPYDSTASSSVTVTGNC